LKTIKTEGRLSVVASNGVLGENYTFFDIEEEAYESIKDSTVYLQEDMFCREDLIFYLRRDKEKEAFFGRGLRFYIFINNPIKQNTDLETLSYKIHRELFGANSKYFFNLYFVGSSLCIELTKEANINLDTTYEKLSLLILILEYQKAADIVVENLPFGKRLTNFLVQLEKENSTPDHKYLWSAIFLDMYLSKGFHSIVYTSGPASTAQALFKMENIIHFLANIEDSKFAISTLKQAKIPAEIYYGDSILKAIEIMEKGEK
jgi:hypothetical protein